MWIKTRDRREHPHDGLYKEITKDCVDCRWYVEFLDETKLCGYGRDFKYLGSARRRLKICRYKDGESSDSSLPYLEEMLKTWEII